MPAPNSPLDLLLAEARPNAPCHPVDAPKLDASDRTTASFDWKPTIILIAVGAMALVAFAYL